MRTTCSILTFTLICLLGTSCQPDPAKQIPALEAALAATNSEGAIDSLLKAYQDAVKAHPDQPTANLHYLTKAAEIYLVRKKNPLEATRLLNSGLEQYGKDQTLTEPIGLLTRIWCAYQYKATPGLSKNPDDIDLMKENLLKNLPWIDSSLIQLDQTMSKSSPSEVKLQSGVFVQISEAYATLVEGTDPNKYVDLMIRAARLAKAVGDPNKALRLYYNVAEKFPNHPKAPEALFLMGFIYENDLKDLNNAKSTYERFLEKYPNDPDYVDDAENGLKYLGMQPEEVLKLIQKNQVQ